MYHIFGRILQIEIQLLRKPKMLGRRCFFQIIELDGLHGFPVRYVTKLPKGSLKPNH